MVFVSKASLESGTIQTYGINKTAVAVEKCRGIGKKDMKNNSELPAIKVTLNPAAP